MTRFSVYSNKGEMLKHAYYLNDLRIPVNDIKNLIGTSPAEVEKVFGKPERVIVNDIVGLKYEFNIVIGKGIEAGFVNLAELVFLVKPSNRVPLEIVMLNYFTRTEEDQRLVESLMDREIEENGFARSGKETHFRNSHLGLKCSKIKVHNTHNISYLFSVDRK